MTSNELMCTVSEYLNEATDIKLEAIRIQINHRNHTNIHAQEDWPSSE